MTTTTRPTIAEQLATSAAELGALPPAEARAVALVALAYATRDRDVWGGDRALTFWDRLPDRVRTGCYRGPTLGHWWEAMTRALGCGQPHRLEDRELLASTLAAGDDRAVLDVLRTQTEMVCLRVRLSIPRTTRRDADD